MSNCTKINNFYKVLAELKREVDVLSSAKFQQPTRKEAIRRGLELMRKFETASAEFWPLERMIDGKPAIICPIVSDSSKDVSKNVIISRPLEVEFGFLYRPQPGAQKLDVKMACLVEVGAREPEASIKNFMKGNKFRFAYGRQLLEFNEQYPDISPDDKIFVCQDSDFGRTIRLSPGTARDKRKGLYFDWNLPTFFSGNRKLLFVKKR